MSSARQWLIENDYEDVVVLIDKVEQIWKSKGAKTRRNWWDVLAGKADGKPKIIENVEFPILAVARDRKSYKSVKHALLRNKDEKAPSIQKQQRWVKHGKK